MDYDALIKNFIKRERPPDKGYRFHDSPQGCDCLKKTWYLTKTCGVAGFFLGLSDALMRTRTKGFLQTANCIAYYLIPAAAMGATFASTSCIFVNLTGKINGVVPAISTQLAFFILHAWQRDKIHSNTFLSIIALPITVSYWIIGSDKSRMLRGPYQGRPNLAFDRNLNYSEEDYAGKALLEMN